MKPIRLSEEAIKQVQQIRKGNSKLYEKLQKKLQIFQENPKHPSLRLHKLRSENGAMSVSIDMSIRVLFHESADRILIVKIGKHEEVYGK